MSPTEALRLDLLRLTKPEGVSVPDVPLWLAKAKELEAWVVSGAGQVERPQQQPPESVATKARTRTDVEEIRPVPPARK